MSPTDADGPALIRLTRAVRAGRRWILVTALGCAVLATVAAVVRGPVYRGTVSISLGAIKPVGSLEDPQDLLRKLQSPAQFSALAGLRSVAEGSATSTVVDGVRISKDDLARLDFHGRQDGARLIQFYVDSPDEQIALAISRHVTRSILDHHARLYRQLIERKKEQIGYYQSLLERIEKKAADSEAEGAWQGVVDVASKISQLDDDQLAPAARPTEIVLGPDVEPHGPIVPPPLAGAIGFIAGTLLAILMIGLLQSLPAELLEAMREQQPTPVRSKTERASDDRSARDVVG